MKNNGKFKVVISGDNRIFIKYRGLMYDIGDELLLAINEYKDRMSFLKVKIKDIKIRTDKGVKILIKEGV